MIKETHLRSWLFNTVVKSAVEIMLTWVSTCLDDILIFPFWLLFFAFLYLWLKYSIGRLKYLNDLRYHWSKNSMLEQISYFANIYQNNQVLLRKIIVDFRKMFWVFSNQRLFLRVSLFVFFINSPLSVFAYRL